MKDLMLVNKEELFDKVLMEHQRQISKWGVQDRSPFEWLCYLTEEIGELNQAVAEYHYRNGSKEEVVKEAIQSITLCLKIAEMFMFQDKDKNEKSIRIPEDLPHSGNDCINREWKPSDDEP